MTAASGNTATKDRYSDRRTPSSSVVQLRGASSRCPPLAEKVEFTFFRTMRRFRVKQNLEKFLMFRFFNIGISPSKEDLKLKLYIQETVHFGIYS